MFIIFWELKIEISNICSFFMLYQVRVKSRSNPDYKEDSYKARSWRARQQRSFIICIEYEFKVTICYFAPRRYVERQLRANYEIDRRWYYICERNDRDDKVYRDDDSSSSNIRFSSHHKMKGEGYYRKWCFFFRDYCRTRLRKSERARSQIFVFTMCQIF